LADLSGGADVLLQAVLAFDEGLGDRPGWGARFRARARAWRAS